ncbi:Integrase family protein [Calothrix sp. PCC 7716]|nr:Integrase family protein [Calothrix sp. PCC 7716]
MVDVDKLILQANERLKYTGVSVKREGKRLVLRAGFPNKPNGAKCNRLSLGWHVTPELIKRAESLARKISGQIDLGEFDWCDYIKTPNVNQQAPLSKKSSLILTAGEWVARYEKNYFDRRARNQKSEVTWRVEYHTVFKQLPQNKPLTADIMLQLALKMAPDTRGRKRYCTSLSSLARFAGIEVDLMQYAGKYGINSTKPKIIPPDIDIAKYFYTVSHPGWQWIYGMIATFGLRNYEPFRVDFDSFLRDPETCVVTDSKTGKPRIVKPFYPEWVEHFNLIDIKLPELSLKRSNSDLGTEASKFFRNTVKLPFTLLPIRHAWAIRTLVFGLDISWAAKMMGHSVEIHSKVYHHWIDAKFQMEAHARVTGNPDRPRPPLMLDT